MDNLDTLLDISVEHNPDVSLENMLYEPYFRTYGVRRLPQMENPKISDLTDAILPKLSIYHYNPESSALFGPLENNPWFKKDKRLRFIDHVYKFNPEPIGTIVKKPGVAEGYINAYRRKHRTLRLLRDFFGVNKSPNMLLVYNYCILNQLYKYRPHRFVNYYNFINFYSTIVTQMNILANTSDRHQFFEVRLPKVLLTRQQYKIFSKEYAENGLSNRLLKYFNDNDSFLILHLWLWMSDNHRNKSIFNRLQESSLSKINLILTDSGKYVILNMAMLNTWRDSAENEDGFTEEDEDGNQLGAQGERLLVRFHKLLTKLFQFRNISTLTTTPVEIIKYTEDEINDTSKIEEDDEVVEKSETILTHTPKDTSLTKDKIDIVVDKLQGNDPYKETSVKGLSKINLKELPDLDENGNSLDEDSDEEMNQSKQAGEPLPEDTILDDKVDEQVYVVDETPTPTFDEVDDTPTYITGDDYIDGPLIDAMEHVESGNMTVREFERIKKQAELFKTQPSPFDPDKTIEEFMKVDSNDVLNIEETVVPDSPWIIDKSMLKTKLENSQKQYIQKVYKKDIVRNIMNLQKAGVMILGMDVEEVKDPTNHYELLKVKVQPIGGAESTLTLKLPVINEEGIFLGNNIKYRLKFQRRDKCVRKVSSDKVALTSYYSKLNVQKAERKTNNLRDFLRNNIQTKIIDGSIGNVQYGNGVVKEIPTSPIYYYVGTRFKHFDIKDSLNTKWLVSFDYNNRSKDLKLNESELNQLETRYKGVVFAKSERGEYKILSTVDNMVYSSKPNVDPIPFHEFVGIEREPPIEFAEIKIFSNTIPLVVMLGYYLGLTKLCKLLGVKPRKIYRGQRSNLAKGEYEVKFADETWIFNKKDYKACLILNGFNHYRRYIQDYSVEKFEHKDVYTAILRDAGIPMQIENEFKLLDRLWIDGITEEMLKLQNEPTKFIPLLIRAVELLTTSQTNDEVNMDDMVIAGYQRIPGNIYKQLATQVKTMTNNRGTGKKRFDLPPNQIYQSIIKDPSTFLVDDINPIHNLKEHESVTFGGDGGRSTRSMVSRTRAYHKSDLGTISEGTVDSANVAVVTFLTASPKFTSVYGTTERVNVEDGENASYISTVSLLKPGSMQDDPKRTLFALIQDSHTVAINGSVPSPVRTGYDNVVAHRVDSKFAAIAKEDGVVKEVSNQHLVIQYSSGKEDRIKLGLNYGVSNGKVINNLKVTDLTVGQKVKEGSVVAYHPGHFSRDYLNPTQVLFKNSVLAKTVFMESNDTEEDSSAISDKLSSKMEMKTTKVRTLIFSFKDTVKNLVKVGDTVDQDSILCTLINSVFSENSMFKESDLSLLEHLSQSSPKAKYKGIVTKIEVLYFGDPSDASDSAKAIISAGNRERARLAEMLKDGSPKTGQIYESIRVDGTPLPKDHYALKIFIEDMDGMGVGDKSVVSNQLKSVVARVMTGTNKTESGTDIDCIFGYQSISNRIVTSAEAVGTSNTLLKLITKEVVDIYRKEHPKK